MSEKKHKAWCWTLHNYSDKDMENIQGWEYVHFLCYGREICPLTGGNHLQGYVEWTSERSFSVIKKIDPRIRWCKADGTGEQNLKYCSKDGLLWTNGAKPKHQGSRTDLNIIKDEISAGVSELEIAENHFETWVRNHKAFEKFRLLKANERREPPKVFWLWGTTGCGKTRTATTSCDTCYIKDGTKWWDMYENQEAIVIDDFDGAWPYRDLLRLLDRYPYRGQVKGGYVNINSPMIFITCEHPPSHFWNGNELSQVERRISEIKHLSGEVPGNTSRNISEVLSLV